MSFTHVITTLFASFRFSFQKSTNTFGYISVMIVRSVQLFQYFNVQYCFSCCSSRVMKKFTVLDVIFLYCLIVLDRLGKVMIKVGVVAAVYAS